MIITFQSAAAGDVIMFGDVAFHMMQIMGKEPGGKGIVTVEQLPDAIARLRAAMAADKADHARAVNADWPQNELESRSEGVPVSLTQRAVPLIELLELSLKKNKPVTWGA
jgi:hypothetical protein